MKLVLSWIAGSEIFLLLITLIAISGCADKLGTVNQAINSHIYSKEYNCKNFAEDKYKELLKQGYKDENMRFIITDYKGEPHVVLNVNGWILDNMRDKPYPATKNLQAGLSYHYWRAFRG